MKNELRPLPADLADLLAAERRAPRPPPAEIDRLLGVIQVRLGSGAPTAPAVTAGAAGALAAKPLLVAVAVVSALGATGGALWLRARGARVSEAVAVSAVSAAPASGPVAPGPGTPAIAESPARTAPTGSPPSGDPRRFRHAPPTDAELAAESALLDKACVALARGDAQGASRALAQHRREFAGGVLVEEREALEVKALARGGDLQGARRQARRFERQFPHSLQLESIARALGENP